MLKFPHLSVLLPHFLDRWRKSLKFSYVNLLTAPKTTLLTSATQNSLQVTAHSPGCPSSNTFYPSDTIAGRKTNRDITGTLLTTYSQSQTLAHLFLDLLLHRHQVTLLKIRAGRS
ncbi:hypothetical protein ATANTOWER_025497 [Ataeniobius toweri]|uniref:Uncharacterized protein n=1 Tax=Ataeniobius toweri TaxID=208326 RepID=A0ABU7BNS4_9TELE|nr:hypothetical protein [Ataeniobius toweri]